MMNLGNGTDLIAFSSESYGSENLRTTLLMNDIARDRRVFFFEKPVLISTDEPSYYIEESASNVHIVRPYLSVESSIFEQKKALLQLLRDVIADEHISHYSMWTDTPTAMPFIRNLSAEIVVYDCLRDYSKSHAELEKELLEYADSVQTTGLNDTVTSGPLRFLKTNQYKETYYSV